MLKWGGRVHDLEGAAERDEAWGIGDLLSVMPLAWDKYGGQVGECPRWNEVSKCYFYIECYLPTFKDFSI
jgi:hypothetical protein